MYTNIYVYMNCNDAGFWILATLILEFNDVKDPFDNQIHLRLHTDGLSNLEAVFLSGLLERMRLFMNFGRHVGFDPL